MLKLTKLTIATTTLLLAISPAAFAQDDARNIAPDIQIVDSFISADIDADGALDRDEFVSFVVMKSDEGDADYKSIKISGEYDNCLLYTSPSPRDGLLSRMPSSA